MRGGGVNRPRWRVPNDKDDTPHTRRGECVCARWTDTKTIFRQEGGVVFARISQRQVVYGKKGCARRGEIMYTLQRADAG
mmetsp:Transcript_228/g.553  ORF Transcript_228/g.553 Transcript_228/m.553 type:complete len:80 (+) Transcript_228:95-334(+)